MVFWSSVDKAGKPGGVQVSKLELRLGQRSTVAQDGLVDVHLVHEGSSKYPNKYIHVYLYKYVHIHI